MSAPWPTLQFDEAVEDASGGNIKTKQNDYAEVGEFPIVDQGKALIAGYTDDEAALCKVPLPVVIFGDHTRCLKFVDFPFGMGADGVKVLKPKAGLDAKFLYHYLRQIKLPDGGYDRHFKYLKRETVPLPPLEEQRRIAAILDQAETLRTQRRTALALLDSLTQSLFLDMFGDPVANPKGWQRLPLRALVEKIDSGWSPVCLDRRAEEGEWAVLKLGAITSCEFKPQENKALPPDIAPVESIEVKPGDLLFSRKNTYELVAACALVNQTPARLMMSDLIFRFRLNASSAVIPQYLHRLLTYATKRQEVQKLAGGSAGSMPNISKAKLLDFLIEVPPLPLQKTFATRIASIEALKTTHRHALAALDALFASLQQRAFTGAL